MAAQLDFNVLNALLPYGEVYLPGTIEYEAAIAIGNLLYRAITPQAVASVRTFEEVQTTITFSKKHKLHLTVKNGGHSYAAYCLNQGGIVLDMSALRKVTVDWDKMTATIQGGAQWKDVYAKLSEHDPTTLVIGGQCPTVGVSGFTLGGGLSPFSRSYGLGIDSLLDMTLVTADGKLVTVGRRDTAEANRDLFWALRGGGGGNFGATVEFTSKLHKLRDPAGVVVCGNLTWKLSRHEDKFLAMMEVFNKQVWPDTLAVDAYWHADAGQDLVAEMTVLFNGPMSECLGVIEPMTRFAPDINIREMKWMDWVQQEMQSGFGIKSKIYHHHISFIFGRESMTKELVTDVLTLLKLAQELLTNKSVFPVLADSEGCSPSSVHFLWDHFGGRVRNVRAEDTAFFWRDGEYAANIKMTWSHPSQTKAMVDFEQKCKQQLTKYTTRGAAYLNYIDDTEANWQTAYYGDNYERLKRIKAHWDPKRFWWFPQAIGEGGPRYGVHAGDESDTTAMQENQIPERWAEFSIKDPLEIDEAGDDVQSVLRANLAIREKQVLSASRRK